MNARKRRDDFLGERVSPIFRYSFVADAADEDELGHISNLAYVRWMQEAASAHSGAVGWDIEAYRALGAFFVVRKHEITYFAQVHAGDELQVVTWVASWKGASSPRSTQVFRKKDGVEVTRGTTLWALMNLKNGRPTRISPEMRADFLGEPKGAEAGLDIDS